MKNRSGKNKKKTVRRTPKLKSQKSGSRVEVDKDCAASPPPAGVSIEFWNVLRERLRADIACGTKYRTNVFYRVLVKDCKKKSIAEIVEMVQGLIDKGKTSAAAICSLSNGKCPDAVLTDLKITRDVCQDRLWDIDAQWTFRCLVLV